MSKQKCEPKGISESDVPEGSEHIWRNFFWSEEDENARQCRRCLRLEICKEYE